MGYIKYDCERFRKNCNQSQSKCSINKLEKILYELDQLDEEIKMEFLETKEILEESKGEIKELLKFTNKQCDIEKEVNNWFEECKYSNESECGGNNIINDPKSDHISLVINEALSLVELSIKKIMEAKELINKKREGYESLRSDCYSELCEDYRYCFKEEEEDDADNV